MFKEYFKELENSDCYETEDGFILYSDNGDSMYITHCYLKPESRGQKKHYPLLEAVISEAKAKGYDYVIASANVGSQTCVMSLKAQLNYGFTPYLAEHGDVWLRYKVVLDGKD